MENYLDYWPLALFALVILAFVTLSKRAIKALFFADESFTDEQWSKAGSIGFFWGFCVFISYLVWLGVVGNSFALIGYFLFFPPYFIGIWYEFYKAAKANQKQKNQDDKHR